ncbi:NAD-dependent epimerase/dehydratase family protein [Dyadobacter alkalitolerans]|uniref:NAD-dependent epimerase/dehydratase family protein n=1 Tax=Dyadobacter alkalitolerans TaxID=492736 RepID=UPI0004210ED8|nr:NAD-dependent epimerase/dehydratase family protein [Dyadobacter alkalitolerans]
MQTILGSGGDIGTPLAKELKKYTKHIRLVARKPLQVNGDDELFKADLLHEAEVQAAVAGSEVVYLTVGFEYKTSVWEKDWPVVMKNVINACLMHKARLVFLDNVYMYAAQEIPHMTEGSRVAPESRKGKVRALIQDLLLNAVSEHGLPALIARSADFYGPSSRNSPLTISVLEEFKKGKKAFWQVDASKLHAFTYTLDAAKAVAILGNTADAFGQVWHLPTSSEKLTGKEFITLIAVEMGKQPDYYILSRLMMRVIGIFVPIVRELTEMAYQCDRDYVFDSSKFCNRFSYTPVTYKEGIKQMVAADKPI